MASNNSQTNPAFLVPSETLCVLRDSAPNRSSRRTWLLEKSKNHGKMMGTLWVPKKGKKHGKNIGNLNPWALGSVIFWWIHGLLWICIYIIYIYIHRFSRIMIYFRIFGARLRTMKHWDVGSTCGINNWEKKQLHCTMVLIHTVHAHSGPQTKGFDMF